MGFSKKASFLSMLPIAICLLTADPALSQTPYYAGKTITIIRGGGPGGSGEFQSRALMPYLKKYIPGNPNIMMEFMDGASGRKAANYFYTAKPDGLKTAPPAGVDATHRGRSREGGKGAAARRRNDRAL